MSVFVDYIIGEFAREARDHQIAGIVVSNHGGRSLDGTQATVSLTK